MTTTILFLGMVFVPGFVVALGIVATTLLFRSYYEGVVLAVIFDLLFLSSGWHGLPWLTITCSIMVWCSPLVRARVRWYA